MNDKNEEMNIKNESTEISSVESTPNNSRRKIIMGSLIVPPVIMSITGRSAWGQARAACTESGQLSGNLSDILANGECADYGCSSELWAEGGSLSGWASYHHFDPASSYNGVFLPLTKVIKDSVTLWQVINGDIAANEFSQPYLLACQANSTAGTTLDQCRASIIALLRESLTALFNSASAVPYELTAAQIAADTEDAFNMAIVSSGTGIAAIDSKTSFFFRLNGRNCPL